MHRLATPHTKGFSTTPLYSPSDLNSDNVPSPTSTTTLQHHPHLLASTCIPTSPALLLPPTVISIVLFSCSSLNSKSTPKRTSLFRTTFSFSNMLEGKAVIGETDMLQAMQQEALHLASKALDSFDVTEPTDIARFIKNEFDRIYGGGWQCIVGTDFGSFVTHCSGCFIYFCVGSLAILLFRGSSGPEAEPNQFMTALDTSVVTA